MTRKDFVLIAKALAASRPANGGDRRIQWNQDVLSISTALRSTNPRFNETKFIEECYK